jgi:hypothetical protein
VASRSSGKISNRSVISTTPMMALVAVARRVVADGYPEPV